MIGPVCWLLAAACASRLRFAPAVWFAGLSLQHISYNGRCIWYVNRSVRLEWIYTLMVSQLGAMCVPLLQEASHHACCGCVVLSCTRHSCFCNSEAVTNFGTFLMHMSLQFEGRVLSCLHAPRSTSTSCHACSSTVQGLNPSSRPAGRFTHM